MDKGIKVGMEKKIMIHTEFTCLLSSRQWPYRSVFIVLTPALVFEYNKHWGLTISLDVLIWHLSLRFYTLGEKELEELKELEKQLDRI